MIQSQMVLHRLEAVMCGPGSAQIRPRRSGRDRLPPAGPSPRLERYNFAGRPQLSLGTAEGQAGLLFSVLLILVG